MRATKVVFFLLLLVFFCGVPYAQDAQSTDSSSDSTAPVPYEDGEFPHWLQAVRRFEIIAIGSFPLTYFAAFLVYDVYRFVAESISAGGVNGLYAPLFFAPPNKPPLSQNETIGVVLAAVGISLVVAIVDLIIQEHARTRVVERARIERAIEENERRPEPEEPEESAESAESVEAASAGSN